MSYKILRYPYTLFGPMSGRPSFRRKVMDEITKPDLRKAYNYCRYITREHAKTFYLATRFLPPDKQRAIFAVYALCRNLDNIVDDQCPGEQKTQFQYKIRSLRNWKDEIIHVYENKYSEENPVLIAFGDVIKSYAIESKLPLLLIEGVSLDLHKKRFADFSEVYDYSYKVASVVGLMTSEIFGYSDKKALYYAVDLGIAMQLTNILRDVGEDLQRNRIYLPQNELRKFGIRNEDLFNHLINQNFKDFMMFQIDRARKYYQNAEKGIALLSQRSRLPVYLALHNYRQILDKIIKNNFQVFEKRACVSNREKVGNLSRIWWKSMQ